MCMLKYWEATFRVFLMVWKVTLEDNNAQQCLKLAHVQLVLGNVGEKTKVSSRLTGWKCTRVCFISSMHVCSRVKFPKWTYFSMTFYICPKLFFSFECGHNAFQFIHYVIYKLLRHKTLRGNFLLNAHFRGPFSEIRTWYYKKKLGINLILHSLSAWVALAEVQ